MKTRINLFFCITTYILISILLTSCATSALWNATDPQEYIAIEATEENAALLQSKGISYIEANDGQYFYAEKSALRKAGDYSMRVFGAPITVTVDAIGGAIVVVGAVTYWTALSLGEQYEETGQPILIYSN